MKIEIAGYGFDVTVDEIKQIISLISGNIHKDKKRLCLLLFLANEILLGWYRAIIKAFGPQLELAIRVGPEDRRPTREELSSLVQFIQQREFEPLVSHITSLLKQTQEHYEEDEKKQTLSSQLYDLRNGLCYFSDTAIGQKVDWFREVLESERREWYVPPTSILSWENDLDSKRKAVRKLTELIEIKLECEKEMVGGGLKKLKPIPSG